MTRESFFRFLRSPRVHAILGLALVIPLLVYDFTFLREHPKSPFDDAYMFIRYAGNMLHGYGVAWNPDGVQTYGVTSLLYLFVIFLAAWLFPSVEFSSLLNVTSFVFGICAPLILAVGCYKLSQSDWLKRYRFLFPILVLVVLLSSSVFRLHTTSGMDTTLSLVCNTLLIFETLRWVGKPEGSSLMRLVIAGYACFLARPDALLYAVLFPILYGWFFLGRERVKTVAWFCLAFASTLLLDTVLKYLVFGDPLPLPFYAKSSGYYDGYRSAAVWNPVSYLFLFFRLILPFLVVWLFAATSKSWRLIAAFLAPVALTFVYFFSVTQVMGFWARYYFPAVPFFIVGSFLALDLRAQDSDTPVISMRTLRAALTALILLFLFLPLSQSTLEASYAARFIPKARVYKSAISENIDGDFPKLGWRLSIRAISELSATLPEGAKIAMSEYGLIGAKSPQVHIIDIVGLHDPFFAHHGFSPPELFRRNPDLIWFPPPDYSKIVASLQDDPTLLAEYDYFPSAFDYGIAVRRNGEYYDLIMQSLTQIWEKNYPGIELEQYPGD